MPEALVDLCKLLIINGDQGRDRTADAGLFRGCLASKLSDLESADFIETISVAVSSIWDG